MKRRTSTHHIVPRSRGGSNHYHNLIELKVNTHVALHCLFENEMPPEQIEHILRINDKALSRDFKEDLARVLQETDPLYYYKNGVLRPKF